MRSRSTSRRSKSLCALGLLFVLFGCFGCSSSTNESDSNAAVPEEPGTLTVTFAASDFVLNDPKLKSPASATLKANLYLAEDVRLTGPSPEAKLLGSVTLPAQDIRAWATTPTTWTSPPLAPGNYIVVGLYDFDDDNNADPGDVGTLPNVSKPIVVESNKDTPAAVLFNILL